MNFNVLLLFLFTVSTLPSFSLAQDTLWLFPHAPAGKKSRWVQDKVVMGQKNGKPAPLRWIKTLDDFGENLFYARQSDMKALINREGTMLAEMCRYIYLREKIIVAHSSQGSNFLAFSLKGDTLGLIPGCSWSYLYQEPDTLNGVPGYFLAKYEPSQTFQIIKTRDWENAGLAWGFLDLEGNWLLPPKPEYQSLVWGPKPDFRRVQKPLPLDSIFGK